MELLKAGASVSDALAIEDVRVRPHVVHFIFGFLIANMRIDEIRMLCNSGFGGANSEQIRAAVKSRLYLKRSKTESSS